MIYFDNASTTKPFDCVTEQVHKISKDCFFNPSALYGGGSKASEIIERSRKVISKKLGALSTEVYFCSCATEANNWVFNCGFKNKKGNIVISEGEHASVFESANLLKSKGHQIKIAKLLSDGTVDTQDLLDKVDDQTALVSIIHCSNETGAINDLKKIIPQIKSKNQNTLIHSDGVAAFCKEDISQVILGKSSLDFYTISGHKIGGPKGVGALYINKKTKIAPFIVGGGQETGMRSGTENTPAIAGFGFATSRFDNYLDQNAKDKIKKMHEYIKRELTNHGWILNGSDKNSGFILSLSYDKIKSEVLMRMLETDGILIGLGSA
ncbi:MAG: aminotransferase class V-fold PLP-dependent enzyme, partial [Firmicutes bacterium]|nr:aminotransferase class V-fold PLP-dependent enzyme [Bacillota bacterium]